MTTRVLGIDPGLLHTGWAVIDTAGQTRKYIASGVILPKTKLEMSERLAIIFRELTQICETFSPDECSIEIIFVNKNPKTTLILGQARAAAIVAVANKNIPVFEYEPNVIKKALTGAGHADKSAIDKMVKILLPAAHPKTADEADAIAIALSHTNMLRVIPRPSIDH
ncbi:MAG: crossover junction endodeoxyribonuclease RuvC [Alphaproteobacteria bacterium]|nr:crossover junction endodeoxyribonuclease RuvC [Alphaproteobacteria bacterium]